MVNVQRVPDEGDYEGEEAKMHLEKKRSEEGQVEEVDEIKKPLAGKDEFEYAAGETKM